MLPPRLASRLPYIEERNAVTARQQLSPIFLDLDRQASQLCRKYQIRRTHDAHMVWRKDPNGWVQIRPFDEIDQAVEYLFNKLPVIESEL